MISLTLHFVYFWKVFPVWTMQLAVALLKMTNQCFLPVVLLLLFDANACSATKINTHNRG